MKAMCLRLFVMLLFLTSCQSPQQAIPTPLSTATPISISALDLSAVLITEGDLPPGYESAQINADLGNLANIAPSPDAFFSQDLSYNQDRGGSIVLLLYEDEAKIPQAYDLIANAMQGDKKDVEVGEIAKLASSAPATMTLTYIRCHAVISIQLIGSSNTDDILSYANTLDKRISPLVCRGGSHE